MIGLETGFLKGVVYFEMGFVLLESKRIMHYIPATNRIQSVLYAPDFQEIQNLKVP
jgi:hypothetical protein